MRPLGLLPIASLLCLSAHPATCTVSSGGISFGRYNVLDHRVNDTVSHITVSCSGSPGESVSISLSLATHNEGRTMKAQQHAVQYGLYLDSARKQPWGNGTASTYVIKDTLILSNGHATQEYTIYG